MVQIHSPRPLLLESAIYIIRKSEERLVRNQEASGSNPLAPPLFSLAIQRVTLRNGEP
jgi:hypothetical protein